MKLRNLLLLLPTLLSLSVFSLADENPVIDAHGHEHEHEEKIAGPNGGRVVTSVEPHYELLVLEDRRLKITFLSDEGAAIAPGAATVVGTGGDRSKPTRFVFTEKDGSLISDAALPEGNEISLILQVKVTPDAKSVAERITMNLATCEKCEHPEYACVCAHDDHDHDHKKG